MDFTRGEAEVEISGLAARVLATAGRDGPSGTSTTEASAAADRRGKAAEAWSVGRRGRNWRRPGCWPSRSRPRPAATASA